MAPPLDFINASPKSGIAVFEVKKRFDSKVLFCEEEGPGKVGSTLRNFYADCGNSFCRIKNMINTHVNVVEGNNPLKFLVYFKGNETNADVRFLRYIAFSMRRNTLLTRPRATCGTLLTSVYKLLTTLT